MFGIPKIYLLFVKITGMVLMKLMKPLSSLNHKKKLIHRTAPVKTRKKELKYEHKKKYFMIGGKKSVNNFIN